MILGAQGTDRVVDDADGGLGLRLRQDERRRDANRVLPGAEHEQAAMETGVDGLHKE